LLELNIVMCDNLGVLLS